MVETATARRTGAVARLLLAVVLVAVAALSLAGCGAGHDAQTGQEVPAIPGADADAGPIELRDLLIPFREGGYPVGSDVPLVVRIFSSAEQPVTVSQVLPGPAGVMTVAAQQISLSQPTPAAVGGVPGAALVVPPGGDLLLTPGSGPYLVARNIAAPLPYGASIPVQFTFSTGDSIDVDVPMAPPDYPVTGPQSAAGAA